MLMLWQDTPASGTPFTVWLFQTSEEQGEGTLNVVGFGFCDCHL